MDYFWVGFTRTRRPFVRAAGDRAAIDWALEVDDDGVITFDSERGVTVFSRDEMTAFPELAEALAAWDRGDQSVRAEDLAVGSIHSIMLHVLGAGTADTYDEEEAAVRPYAGIPACREFLEVLGLLRRLEEIGKRRQWAMTPGPWPAD